MKKIVIKNSIVLCISLAIVFLVGLYGGLSRFYYYPISSLIMVYYGLLFLINGYKLGRDKNVRKSLIWIQLVVSLIGLSMTTAKTQIERQTDIVLLLLALGVYIYISFIKRWNPGSLESGTKQ